MAVTEFYQQDQEASVVGMSGIPVQGGAGIKSPLLRNKSGQYFSYARAQQLYDPREIESYEQRGLLSRTEYLWEPVEAGIILYAHCSFIDPGSNLLKLDSSRLHRDNKLDTWIKYEECGKALRQLARWGRALIIDAHRCLKEAPNQPADTAKALIERALDDARRARFCAPPEDLTLREDVFVYWAAAWMLQDRPIEPLLRYAQRDQMDSARRAKIEIRAARLARTEKGSNTGRIGSKYLSWDHRDI